MQPQTPNGLINDVTAPAKEPTGVALAEPPKEMTFVEEPVAPRAETPVVPTVPVVELAAEPTLEAAPAAAAVVKSVPTKKTQPKDPSTKMPVFAIALSVTLFVALAAVAYYAYTKTA